MLSGESKQNPKLTIRFGGCSENQVAAGKRLSDGTDIFSLWSLEMHTDKKM